MGGFSFLKPSREDRRRKSMMQYSTARRNNLSSLSEMEDPDYEGVEEIARRMRVLLPNSWFRSTWDWVLIGLVMYNLINIPLEICFVYIAPPGVEAFNIVVDTLFIIDLLLNFRTAFYEGVALTPIIDLKQIARHYIFGPSGRSIGWFWPDLLAGIPFDWVPSRDLDTAAVLSFAKLGRIFRVGRLVKKLDKFTAARFVRVANVLIFILLTTNALACIWWRIGYDTPEFRGWQFRPHAAATLLQYNPMDADDELLVLPTGMLNKTRLYELFQTEVGMDKKYLTSLYWALTVVMKSPWLPPEMASEQVFSAIAIVASVMLFAGFVATLTATVNAFDKSHAAYRDKVALLRHFFQVRPQLSSDLKRKAFRYADAYFKQTIDGASEAAVLAHLPEHLRPTALLELNLDLIKSMPWLQETSFVCCTDFVSSLKPEILLRNDVLLKAGVISRNFYILTQGEVVVIFPPDGANLSSVGKALGFDAKTLAKVLSAAESFDARKSKRVNPGRFERPVSPAPTTRRRHFPRLRATPRDCARLRATARDRERLRATARDSERLRTTARDCPLLRLPHLRPVLHGLHHLAPPPGLPPGCLPHLGLPPPRPPPSHASPRHVSLCPRGRMPGLSNRLGTASWLRQAPHLPGGRGA